MDCGRVAARGRTTIVVIAVIFSDAHNHNAAAVAGAPDAFRWDSRFDKAFLTPNSSPRAQRENNASTKTRNTAAAIGNNVGAAFVFFAQS